MTSLRHRLLFFQLLVISSFVLFFYTMWNRNSLNADQPYGGSVLDPAEAGKTTHGNLENLLGLLSANSDFPANINKLQQEDQLLHKFVHLRHMTPPSKQPYNLPGHRGSHYMNTYVVALDKLFKQKKNGVFIEAGAFDGVSASNTLYLEKTLEWGGLLVECNPMTVPFLKMKNRKAWIADVCLSQTEYPANVNFSNPTKWGPSAKIGDPVDLSKWGIKTDWTQFQVTSIPLFALLASINLTGVDFFSLDVEGAEFEVLKTIPWDKVSIKSIFVEVNQFSSEVKGEIQVYLESKGFTLFDDYDSDQLYVHSSFRA